MSEHGMINKEGQYARFNKNGQILNCLYIIFVCTKTHKNESRKIEVTPTHNSDIFVKEFYSYERYLMKIKIKIKVTLSQTSIIC